MLAELREIRRELSTQTTMTPTTDFNDLTPPDDLMERWAGDFGGLIHAARWGARHGWEQARQLWPEPIDGKAQPPTEKDGDAANRVQVIIDTDYPLPPYWSACNWEMVGNRPWQHTLHWQPRQPSLQEQALATVKTVLNDPNIAFLTDVYEALELASRALEQAGEAQQ